MKYIYGTLTLMCIILLTLENPDDQFLKLPSVSNVRYKCHDFVQMNIEL